MLYSQPYAALHRRRGPSTKTRSSSPHVEVENKRISGRLGHARHSSVTLIAPRVNVIDDTNVILKKEETRLYSDAIARRGW